MDTGELSEDVLVLEIKEEEIGVRRIHSKSDGYNFESVDLVDDVLRLVKHVIISIKVVHALGELRLCEEQ